MIKPRMIWHVNTAKWSRGMIRALGARGPGFESPFGPHILLVENTGRDSANVFFQWKCTCFLHQRLRINFFPAINTARLAQSVEHETLNLRVVGSSPTLGGYPFAKSWQFTGTIKFYSTFVLMITTLYLLCRKGNNTSHARLVVRTLCCGRSNPGSNSGHRANTFVFAPTCQFENLGIKQPLLHKFIILDSLVVRISACHVEGPGSIPGRGEIFDLFNCPVVISILKSLQKMAHRGIEPVTFALLARRSNQLS